LLPVTLLFSYGTLRNPEIQLEVFGRELSGSPDELLGFTRRQIELRDPAFTAAHGSAHLIVQQTGRDDDRVAGTVLDITDADLASADAFEPPNYRRMEARFASGRRGWVYAEDSARASK